MKYNAFYIQLLYKTKYIVNNVMCGVEDSFFGPHGITSLATHATSIYY